RPHGFRLAVASSVRWSLRSPQQFGPYGPRECDCVITDVSLGYQRYFRWRIPMYVSPVEVIETEFYARLPENLKIRNRETEYTRVQTLGLHKPDSGLEGPSFDREGNLYCVDTPWGRIFRIDTN